MPSWCRTLTCRSKAMSKYRVIANGYGFQGRYWEVGQVVEIDPAEKPPNYFQLVEVQQTAEPKAETPEALPEAEPVKPYRRRSKK